MKNNGIRFLLLFLLLLLFFLFHHYGIADYVSLKGMQEQKTAFQAYADKHPITAMGGYFTAYLIFSAFALPGAVIITLLGGALFGVVLGTVLVSFGSSLGALLAFLLSRYLLRSVIQERFGNYLKTFNKGMREDGGLYLFTLRLVPLFPFFAINLVMGLTPLKGWTFYWISQLGMLPVTLIYVNAGTQLSTLESVSGLLSPSVIASLVLLGVFPVAAKKGLAYIRMRRNQP